MIQSQNELLLFEQEGECKLCRRQISEMRQIILIGYLQAIIYYLIFKFSSIFSEDDYKNKKLFLSLLIQMNNNSKAFFPTPVILIEDPGVDHSSTKKRIKEKHQKPSLDNHSNLNKAEKFDYSKLKQQTSTSKYLNFDTSKLPADNKLDRSSKTCQSFYEEQSKIFQKLFSLLDMNDDRIIRREEFVEVIFTDSQCQKILDKPVFKFNLIQKEVSFRQMISFIVNDYRLEKNAKLKKSKQYITLERFNEYFQVPESLDLRLICNQGKDKAKQTKSSEIEIFDIKQEHLLNLKDIFDSIPRVFQEFAATKDFVNLAQNDPLAGQYLNQNSRGKSIQTGLSAENVKMTLQRLSSEADQYSSWDSIKEFFSRRGRPVTWSAEENLRKRKNRQANDNNGENFESIVKKYGNYLTKDSKSKQKHSKINRRSPLKYTIPEPFDITDQRNSQKQKISAFISSQEMEMQQMKKQFRAKPINKEIFGQKPELIQGRTQKSKQKNQYNYENYQNDRIERTLAKAQKEFEQQEKLKEIKRMSQVKAHKVKVDLSKTLKDVTEQQKQRKKRMQQKAKPTKPSVSSNLYPENIQDQKKKKLEKIQKNMQKVEEAGKMKEQMTKQMKEKAKQNNKKVKQLNEQQKKKEKQQQQQASKLIQNSFKPKINQHNLSEAQKEAIRKTKEQKQKKKQEGIQNFLQAQEERKKKIMGYQKKVNYIDINGLQVAEILASLENVNFEDLFEEPSVKNEFQKQYSIRGNTKKQMLDNFSGRAGREKAAIENEEKRMVGFRKKAKQSKQQKKLNDQFESSKQVGQRSTGGVAKDKQFNCSKALRRYRAIIEGKEPLSEFDKYSTMGHQQNV